MKYLVLETKKHIYKIALQKGVTLLELQHYLENIEIKIKIHEPIIKIKIQNEKGI